MEHVIDDPDLVYAITYAVGYRGGIQAAAHNSSVATVGTVVLNSPVWTRTATGSLGWNTVVLGPFGARPARAFQLLSPTCTPRRRR